MRMVRRDWYFSRGKPMPTQFYTAYRVNPVMLSLMVRADRKT
jgi:hypothetical protein